MAYDETREDINTALEDYRREQHDTERELERLKRLIAGYEVALKALEPAIRATGGLVTGLGDSILLNSYSVDLDSNGRGLR